MIDPHADTRTSPAPDILARARRVRCLVLDVDGVMTDGKLYLGPDGAEWKTTDVRDGLGIRLLLRAGIVVAVISGRPSAAIASRLASLGVRHVQLGVADKSAAFNEVRDALDLDDAALAVMGDDLPDLPLMQRAGLAMTVADAHPCAISAAHWISRFRGGQGAIREAADLLLAARGEP